MEILQTILVSLLSGGSVAWVILKLFVKDTAREVVKEELVATTENIHKTLENYTTNEDMQLERKGLLEEVREQYLSLFAFREVEKRFDENFKTIDRRLNDSSKRIDKLDAALEHITDLIIQKNN